MTTRKCARWRGAISCRSATGSARPAAGQAALEILQAGDSFDLLLTDVVMPDGMTGYQLAAAARHLLPGMKVLFTTGYSDRSPADDLAGPAAGAMLRKPYRRQELAAAVRAALEA